MADDEPMDWLDGLVLCLTVIIVAMGLLNLVVMLAH